MRKIGIMADSHSGILKKGSRGTGYSCSSHAFYLNGELSGRLKFFQKGFL